MMPDDLSKDLGDAFDQVSTANTGGGNDAGQGDAPARSQPEAREETGAGEAAQRARDEAGRFAKEKADRADAERKDAGKAGGKDAARQTLTLKPKEPTGGKNAAQEQERQAPTQQQGVAKAGTPQGAQTDQGREAQAGNTGDGQQTANGAVVQAVVAPPAHWSGHGKVAWEKLPPAVREAIAADHQAVAPLREIAPAVQHFAQDLMAQFGNVGNGLGSVLTLWRQYRQNPLDTIRGLMQQSGIHPQALMGAHGAAPNGTGQLADSQQAATPQYVTQADLADLFTRAQADAATRAQANQIHSEVGSFGSTANADGTLKYPYFNDVRPLMSALFMADKSGRLTLEGAYNQAVYADPAIRQQLTAQEQAKQADERARAAATAKNAGASIAGAPGGNRQGQPQNETISQTLDRVYNDAAGGRRI